MLCAIKEEQMIPLDGKLRSGRKVSDVIDEKVTPGRNSKMVKVGSWEGDKNTQEALALTSVG